jgi:hypothetical protein
MGEAQDRDARIEWVAATVEHYVTAHPNASDTLAGIHRWWLVNISFEEDTALLEAAVERLVERGVMTRRPLADGTVVFSGKAAGVQSGREGGARPDNGSPR